MDTETAWLIPLARAADDPVRAGGKAARLAALARDGHRIPEGFCVTVDAYEHFLAGAGITGIIRMELGRKAFGEMRWEELWDAALRIRTACLAASVPADLAGALAGAVEDLGQGCALAVRSSAPGEDSAERSFAGIHESFTGVVGADAVLDSVRLVWASLWSDAALLYRQELALDPERSRMAVLVQRMVEEDRSGVAFGRDPRDAELDREVIEAVPGACAGLVDGLLDPDRWILNRSSGAVIEHRRGMRKGGTGSMELLDPADLDRLHRTLAGVERSFGWPADLEWTGRSDRFTLLQARPITSGGREDPDEREWYLSLRPGRRRLEELGRRVVEELIPRLEREGEDLAAENLEVLDDAALADAIEGRLESLARWRGVYRDDFIPFAHGVRRLATYYNDAVRPEDPYEFVGLLKGEDMLASRRNRALAGLAARVAAGETLRGLLETAATEGAISLEETLGASAEGASFLEELAGFRDVFMDTAFAGVRLSERPDLLVRTILELARAGNTTGTRDGETAREDLSHQLEGRLLEAVGEGRREEALEVIHLARLSWRLRDDDNLLVGRIESQLLRALAVAAERLHDRERLADSGAREEDAPALAGALRDPHGGTVALSRTAEPAAAVRPASEEKPRQLTGQPASPGMSTGLARLVRGAEDLAGFRAGEVLVCDAIQPTMTHLVPLAAAIVERRGGMLIHGAIIARELGIPCVNGIPRATEDLRDGDLLTVDGHLGIVTVGEPEFRLELSGAEPAAG